MKRLLLIALPLALAACAGGVPVQVEYRPVPYPVPAACPDEAVHADLTARRPVPLAAQPKPPTAVERAARIAAQLGQYEAPGGWADLVMAALDRCQQEPVDAPLDSG